MPRRKPASTSGGHLRREIAGLAARLIAEDGIDDYGFAKRKAARSLGVGEGESLPTNDEVEAELRIHQAIYQDEELPERLKALRETALEVMEVLAEFRPYLTGAALEGTAGRYSGIDIELYADSAKDVEIMLLSHNIRYDPSESRRNRPDAPEAQLMLDWDEVPVRVSVFPLAAERRQRRGPHGGHAPARARADEVAALLG